MTLQEHKKLAENTMRLLKVRYMSYPIAKTEKGDLYIKYIKDVEGYEILLDAVPLDMKEYDNREYQSVLEKYFFAPEPEDLPR